MNLKHIIIGLIMVAQITASADALIQDKNLFVKKLSNGLTIAVYPNSEPPKRVSMRLLVKRGSAAETEAERGIAHFTEHMAFNGTKNFPAGDMVEYFQRLGMAFGADTNAHTGFSETVYKLDMPENSKELITDGLRLLRDYADGILFEDKAIDNERGVIIAEKKSRDSRSYRQSEKEIAHYFAGTKFKDRMPIGLESVIEKANRQTFLDFYRQNYRPENIVLVIVGDVKAKEVIGSASEYFEDMNSNDYPARKIELGNLEITDKKFDFNAKSIDFDAVYDSASNCPVGMASIAVSKLKPEGDNFKRRLRNAKMATLSNAISARYARVSDSPESKISGGSGGNFTFDNYVDTFIFSAQAPVGGSEDALLENFKQLLSLENLSNEEIENAKKKVFADIQAEIDSESTRKNPELANDITSAFSDEEIFTSAEFDMEVAKKSLENFDAQAAKNLLKENFDNAKIKVFLADNKPEPSVDNLKKLVAENYSKALANKYPESTFAQCPLVFEEFPSTPAQVKSSSLDEELNIHQFEMLNGIALNIKQTDFSKDEVLLKISFGNGLLDLPKDKPEFYVANYAFICGGTKYQSYAEINAAQYAMKFSISFGMEGNTFYIMGKSTRKDFANMLKLCATMIAAPGFREDGMESLKKYGNAFYRNYATSPISRIRYTTTRLSDSNFKDVPGTQENFDKITMKDVEKWMTPILKNSPMEISIVGDIEKEKVIGTFCESFGQFEKRESAKNWKPFVDVKMSPAGTELNMVYETTDEPRSISARIWLSCGRQNIEDMRTANILGAVLDDILRKEIREKEGKVYSPFANNTSSPWMRDIGLMLTLSFVVPEYNQELGDLLEKCGLLAAESIDKDLFERAKIPMLKSVEANLRKNIYWLDAVMNRSHANPDLFKMAKDIKSGYSRVTLEEVSAMAKDIFKKKPYKISVMPDKKESPKN